MRVKGALLVNKRTLKITGSYETKKPNADGWFAPGTLSGKMLVRTGSSNALSVKSCVTAQHRFLLWPLCVSAPHRLPPGCRVYCSLRAYSNP